MITRLQVAVIVIVTITLLVIFGAPLHPVLKASSSVITVLFLLLTMFNLWLWKWRYLKGWFVRRPYLWGNWIVEFDSDYIDTETKKRTGLVRGYADVWQTYSKLRIRVYTTESSSDTLGLELCCEEDGCYLLTAVYRNEPRISVREQSPIHWGAFQLKAPNDAPNTVEGHYWTDRKSVGEMRLFQRQSKRCGSYEVSRQTRKE